jgi:gluconate 2-dehydrogenase gamma chain
MNKSKRDPIVVPVIHPDAIDQPRVSRRFFLKSSGAAVASTGAVTIGSVAALDHRSALAQDATPVASPDAGMSGMEGMAAEERAFRFFNIHEAETVDALVSRILPGTADDPGAHEAGVVYYIDRNLGGTNQGYTLKT